MYGWSMAAHVAMSLAALPSSGDLEREENYDFYILL